MHAWLLHLNATFWSLDPRILTYFFSRKTEKAKTEGTVDPSMEIAQRWEPMDFHSACGGSSWTNFCEETSFFLSLVSIQPYLADCGPCKKARSLTNFGIAKMILFHTDAIWKPSCQTQFLFHVLSSPFEKGKKKNRGVWSGYKILKQNSKTCSTSHDIGQRPRKFLWDKKPRSFDTMCPYAAPRAPRTASSKFNSNWEIFPRLFRVDQGAGWRVSLSCSKLWHCDGKFSRWAGLKRE